ncbi:uncharacterized protein [Mytilus edulis]|uniref:uncharacterized protein n=1 Tax=Mytilus edulis TaxID=6550 RepID=UPI0039EE1663
MIKRKAGIHKKNRITFRLPIAFFEAYMIIFEENVAEKIERSNYNNSIQVIKDKIRIDSHLFESFFAPTIDQISFHLKEMFNDYGHAGDLTDIVLVGGFTECILVQNVLHENFRNKHFIIPKGAEVAVIEGAVLCGHQPYQKIIIPPLQGLSNSILTNLSQLNKGDFKDLVALGTFASYENKVYLAGPCNTGKSSLASILIGEKIPKTWVSTDGLIIHFGRNGIDLLERKMIPLQIGSGDVLTKLLLGHPELKQQPSQHTAYRSRQNVDERKVHNAPMSSHSHTDNESSILMKTERDVLRQEQTKHSTESKKQSFDGRPVSPVEFDQKRQTYTARYIQEDVLNKIKKGTYVMNIAPSDLVDFGGQKSFDMTHQLFIQHRGTFILMFDGRKGLYTELEEYQPGNVTAASILEHWINSVLTYSSYSDDKMPRIMFAATHSDQFSKVSLTVVINYSAI